MWDKSALTLNPECVSEDFKIDASKDQLGSCYLEMGNTKVLARVDGPFASTSERSNAHVLHRTERIPLDVHCTFSPLVAKSRSEKRSNQGESVATCADSAESLAGRVLAAIVGAMKPSFNGDEQTVVHRFALHCDLLEADGGVFAALCTASVLALASAGVSMHDLPVGVTATLDAKSQKWRFDASASEEADADTLIDCCVLPAFRQFGAFEMRATGGHASLSLNDLSSAQQTCLDAAASLHAVLRPMLLKQAAVLQRGSSVVS